MRVGVGPFLGLDEGGQGEDGFVDRSFLLSDEGLGPGVGEGVECVRHHLVEGGVLVGPLGDLADGLPDEIMDHVLQLLVGAASNVDVGVHGRRGQRLEVVLQVVGDVVGDGLVQERAGGVFGLELHLLGQDLVEAGEVAVGGLFGLRLDAHQVAGGVLLLLHREVLRLERLVEVVDLVLHAVQVDPNRLLQDLIVPPEAGLPFEVGDEVSDVLVWRLGVPAAAQVDEPRVVVLRRVPDALGALGEVPIKEGLWAENVLVLHLVAVVAG